MNFHLPTRRVFGDRSSPSPSNPTLPTEVLIKVLYELTLVDILLCRRVSKRFNHAITNSLLLQYRIELGVGALMDRPGKHSTSERLEALRRYRFGWRNLAWRRRDIVNVDHPRGSLCQLSGGLFVSGKREKPGTKSKLLFVELPSSASKTGAPRRSELECDIEVAHMSVDLEQDLLVLIEDRSRAAHGPQFRVHIRSLLTNYPHPDAALSILEYDCKSGWYNYQFMIQIMGKHVGILFTSGILGDSDFERLVIWDWTTGLVRGTISMPNSRYDAFTFISEYALALPCARTESINIFVFRPAPADGYGDPGPYIRHVCALQLPPLVPGAKYISVHCRSQPAPTSRTVPKRRGGLRRPDKMFETDHSDGIVSFPIHCFNHSGNRAKDLTLVAHRSTLLSLMPMDAMADLFSTKTSVLVFWEPYGMCPTEAWGPPIPWEWWGAASCRFTLDRQPPRLTYDTHGHRLVRLIHEGNPYAAHIQVQDYNPFSLRHPLLLEDDHNPTLEQHVCRRVVTDPSVVEADGFFQVDVVTRLPYYEVTTLTPYSLTGVMIDGERVVGMKTDSPGGDDIVAVDVFIM